MLELFVLAVRYALPLCVSVAILLASRCYAPMERPTITRITWLILITSGSIALVLAWLRLNTTVINIPTLNAILLPPMFLSAAAFLTFTAILGKNDPHSIKQNWRHRALNTTALLTTALIILTYGFEYCFSADAIVLMGSTLLESESLARLAGFLLGTALVTLAAWSFTKSAKKIPSYLRFTITTAVMLTIIGPRAVLLYHQFSVRGQIPKIPGLFDLVLWIQAHNVATLLVLACLLSVPGIMSLWFKPDLPPQDNTATRRLLRAEKISRRHFLELSAASMSLFMLTLTVGKARAEYVPELSPIEPSTVKNGQVLVERNLVSDGHLHRFGYQTKQGTEVRFVVIKKNPTAYGTGLDACEICGDSGYYEDEGRVVCRRCNVMMNIQTIGFPGGCNPIPIKHEISEKHLLFSVDELESHADIFA